MPDGVSLPGDHVEITFGSWRSLYQEAANTQLSRGRLSNNLYVASPENPRWEIGHHATTSPSASPPALVEPCPDREQPCPGPSPELADRDGEDLDAPSEHTTLGQWIAITRGRRDRQLADA